MSIIITSQSSIILLYLKYQARAEVISREAVASLDKTRIFMPVTLNQALADSKV
jgi:hypothetical protein